MDRSKFFAASSLIAVLSIPTIANAALVSRLGGLAYYDTESDLTWLADANYAMTSGYDTDGLMNWAGASTWAANLNIAGVAGWRLPDTLQPDPSCSNQDINGSTGSEMGDLFYNVLGGVAHISISATHNANYDLFSNIQSSVYWTSTESVYHSSNYYYAFISSDNHQGIGYSPHAHHAWAVYDGDIGAVPVPGAVWLFGSGLIGLIGFARRKSNV